MAASSNPLKHCGLKKRGLNLRWNENKLNLLCCPDCFEMKTDATLFRPQEKIYRALK